MRSLFVLSDSKLMVHQMNGVYKIKNLDILKKVQEAKRLAACLDKFTISYIARENNTMADALSTAQIPKKQAGTNPDDGADLLPALPDDPDDGATE